MYFNALYNIDMKTDKKKRTRYDFIYDDINELNRDFRELHFYVYGTVQTYNKIISFLCVVIALLISIIFTLIEYTTGQPTYFVTFYVKPLILYIIVAFKNSSPWEKVLFIGGISITITPFLIKNIIRLYNLINEVRGNHIAMKQAFEDEEWRKQGHT